MKGESDVPFTWPESLPRIGALSWRRRSSAHNLIIKQRTFPRIANWRTPMHRKISPFVTLLAALVVSTTAFAQEATFTTKSLTVDTALKAA
jgi:hypothetical protein